MIIISFFYRSTKISIGNSRVSNAGVQRESKKMFFDKHYLTAEPGRSARANDEITRTRRGQFLPRREHDAGDTITV